MLFNDITYIDELFAVHEHACIGVRGKHIDYIGSLPPENAADYGRIYDGLNKLLISGFYNTHSHASMTLVRGYGENLPLHRWLNERIFPFEDRLTGSDIYWGALLSCAEMLRFGIVSTTDMYMNMPYLCQAFRDGGVKANISAAVTCFDDRSFTDMPQYTATLDALPEFQDADDGRIKLEFSMHAEYTSTEKIARSIAEAAARHNLAMHVHVSETASEVAGCRERHNGRTPIEYLSDCGLFDVRTTAAHCVHLTDEDIMLLSEKKVNVATCPRSNLKLASGIAPVPALQAAGVNVSLATDSVSSNNNLNFIEEMRVCSLLHKGVSGDATLLTPAQSLAMATQNGARSQNRPDCGAIKVGNRADLTVLELNQPHLHPQHDVLCNLLYSATGSDVVLTMVDGRICYENGDWPLLDIEKIYGECSHSVKRILNELAGI